MSNGNNNRQQQQQRGLLVGGVLAVGAAGLLAGLATDHVQAREENRESVVQGFGRWVRESVLGVAGPSPSGGGGTGAGSSTGWGGGGGTEPTPRRLSAAEIALLPTRRLDNVQSRRADDDEEYDDDDAAERTRSTTRECNDEKAFCVVCREQYENGDVLMRLPCFHEFHAECIREYLETSEAPRCPICRHPITVQ